MDERTTLPTRRPWFQSQLGTLLVTMKLFVVWLGWELMFARDRRGFLRRVDATNGIYGRLVIDSGHPERPTVPPWRRWLGDSASLQLAWGKNTKMIRSKQMRLA